tara:strand:- start:383 stop:562 length:180 start_codon:yes stop_codon:yes gene_type:complete
MKRTRVTELTPSKSKGLGDTIEKFTKATGIKKIVETMSNGDCGCSKRKDSLNRAFPYSK